MDSAISVRKQLTPYFHSIPVTTMESTSWTAFIGELQLKAPTLLLTLLTLVSYNDQTLLLVEIHLVAQLLYKHDHHFAAQWASSTTTAKIQGFQRCFATWEQQ